MYMNDTTMYMDILPLDINNPQKMEPNKLLPTEPNDPWLVSQAGISDIQFPITNTTNNTSLFGRLSPGMEQLANSLLSTEISLPQIDDTFDIDFALDSFSTEVRNKSFLQSKRILILLSILHKEIDVDIFNVLMEWTD